MDYILQVFKALEKDKLLIEEIAGKLKNAFDNLLSESKNLRKSLFSK
jgi:hypothetical protein